LKKPYFDPDAVMLRLVTNLTAQPGTSIYVASRDDVNAVPNEVMAFARGHPGVQFPGYVNRRRPAATVVRLVDDTKGRHLNEFAGLLCPSLTTGAGTIACGHFLDIMASGPILK
jgi:hypothetical protein